MLINKSTKNLIAMTMRKANERLFEFQRFSGESRLFSLQGISSVIFCGMTMKECIY